MPNPLLASQGLVSFSKIKPEHIQVAIKSIIQENRQIIEDLLQQSHFTWENLIQPLDDINEKLSRAWTPVSHLNAVKNSPELRQAYDACLPLLSEYSTWLGQHKGLYHAYLALKQSDAFEHYSQAQQKSIHNALRDFELSGIALSDEQKIAYAQIVARLSELNAKFSNNVLDATMGWEKIIEDEALLAGLPERAIQMAKQSAQSKGKSGYRFTLEFPSYLPVITYAENRQLREECYRAFSTRASEQEPNGGKWDNTAVMQEILQLRLKLANLLGFERYTDYSLATKMAENPNQVLDFLGDLAKRAKKQGQEEFQALQEFCQKTYGINELAPWDLAFYSEKQKEASYQINDEQLRPYFPEDRVLSGLFELISRLFNINVEERFDIDCWDESVRFFELKDPQGCVLGRFYLDLYARENKRGGAWMNDYLSRKVLANGEIQVPVAFLTCNFNAPIGDKPALFTHDEVTTLFHEFGHGIHHMLTKIDVQAVNGINGVPWDAVELPSQFLENFCWQPDALAFISGHYLTGEPLPRDLLEKLIKAKNFQSALFVLRQLEFGLFDFRLHHYIDPHNKDQILHTFSQIKEEISVIPYVNWVRTPHSFSHIFAGGYSAGYYSYLWAEVLSADAFSRFEEEGIFNPQTGQDFLHCILSQGGSEEPMVLFERFRGRKPIIDALLRHKGIKG